MNYSQFRIDWGNSSANLDLLPFLPSNPSMKIEDMEALKEYTRKLSVAPFYLEIHLNHRNKKLYDVRELTRWVPSFSISTSTHCSQQTPSPPCWNGWSFTVLLSFPLAKKCFRAIQIWNCSSKTVLVSWKNDGESASKGVCSSSQSGLVWIFYSFKL